MSRVPSTRPHSVSKGYTEYESSNESTYTTDSDSTLTSSTSSGSSGFRRWRKQREREKQRTRHTLSESPAKKPTRRLADRTLRNWTPIGKPGVSLCNIEFRNAAEAIPAMQYAMANPGGETKPFEGPENLSDGIANTRWCDFKCAPLMVTFTEPVLLTDFRLKTAYCDPSKDPVLWIIHTTEDPSDPVWRVAHEQTTVGPLKLDRMASTEWIKLDHVMPCVQLRFQVLRVRGSPEDWRNALKESSILRSKKKAAARTPPRARGGSLSPTREPPLEDLSECTFKPRTNENHIAATTPESCMAHFKEWTEKGSSKIRRNRLATRPKPKQSKPCAKGIAKSHELYAKVSESQQKRAAVITKYANEESALMISHKVKRTPDTFKGLMEKAKELQEKKEAAKDDFLHGEAMLRGKNKVFCEEDPWRRLFLNKKRRPEYETPKRAMRIYGEGEDDMRECTFSPVTHGPPPASVMQPRMETAHAQSTSHRSKTVTTGTRHSPARVKQRGRSVTPPRPPRTWAPPNTNTKTNLRDAEHEQYSTPSLMHEGLALLYHRLEQVEGHLGLSPGDDELRSNEDNHTITDGGDEHAMQA
eukprot:TRINITY_DN20041_c0_g1_i1.p1 TRINITY_DN20041_c0_g1~~TRINITY_DN20041_c0_g1_i1.p1  ORF type:complete len:586 (+),score=127.33 TRINITY_DN20041_c0_g1_i1:89-1846(+)